MDYQALNNLLLPVTKAYSKAKGVLTLVPLPKFDKMHAKMASSSIYSTPDVRIGYHHIALSVNSQEKISFYYSNGKI